MSDLKDFSKRLAQQLKGKKAIPVDIATSKMIMAVRNKFETLYPLFIQQIEMKDIPERSSFYRDLKKGMKRISELSNILLGDKGRSATEDEISEYIELTKTVSSSVDEIVDISKKTESLKKEIDSIEEKTGISLEALKNFSKVFSQGISSRSQRAGGLLSDIKDFGYASSGLLEGRTTLGGKMGLADVGLNLALGPFAPLAKYGLSAGTKFFSKMLEKRRAKQMLGGEIGLMSKQFGISPSDIDSFRRTRDFGDPLGKTLKGYPNISMDDLMKQYNQGMSGSQQPQQSQVSYQTKSADFNSREVSNAFRFAMYRFYVADAFNAPYTKRLLAAVENIHGKSGSGAGGFMSQVGGAIGNALKSAGAFIGGAMATGAGWLLGQAKNLASGVSKFLGPVAGIAAAGIAGWEAGRFLGENIKWGGQTLDKHVQNFAEKNVFGKQSPDVQVGKQQQQSIESQTVRLMDSDPSLSLPQAKALATKQVLVGARRDSVRVHQLQTQGLTLDEAVAKADSEIRGGGRSLVEMDSKLQIGGSDFTMKSLVGALKEAVGEKRNDSQVNPFPHTIKDYRNDPFVDLFNAGQFGEAF